MTLPTVAGIEDMDRAALLAAWDQIFDLPVPKSLSRPLLRRFLAFEVQARQRGRLPRGFLSTLDKRVRDLDGRTTPTPAPGGRLLREWNGTTHVVEITRDGYLWNGQTWPSLSAVARAITGARWSGPRFFGLREGS